MDKNIIYLLHILKCFICNCEVENNEDVDWDTIYNLGLRHEVLPIIYIKCKRFMVDERFKKAYFSQIYRFSIQRNAVKEFSKIVNGTRYIFFKGMVIAELYEFPFLRTMSDTDVLIWPIDLNKVERMLLEEGAQNGPEEHSYLYKNHIFELHGCLIHDYQEHRRYKEYFENVWEYINDGKLDWNYHFVYLITHLKNHLVGSGVGIRQFMDIALVAQKKNLNWDWILSESKKIGLDKFAVIVMSLIKCWFGVDCGIELKVFDETFYRAATMLVLNNGVFGMHDTQDADKISIIMGSDGDTYFIARTKYIIRQLFPQLSEMKKIQYTKYINYSPIFLPIAWIHRWVYCVFKSNKRENFKHIIFLNKEKVMENANKWSSWGLE